MITVNEIRMDFRVGRERFARELYGRWDAFCRTGVEDAVCRALERYDTEEEVIRVERLELDLGRIAEEEFYEVFPGLMSGKLEEVFGSLIRHREAYPVEIISLHRDCLQVLMYFLLTGRLPGNVPEEYRDLKRLLWVTAGDRGHELGRMLRRSGERMQVRRRLVRQFGDRELERAVEVTEPSEASFIKVYTRSVIASWPRLRRPEITSGDYRDVVWEVVWAYLLCDGRSFFSRKRLVRYTVAELAAHFNLSFFYLLRLLTAGLKRMVPGWMVMPELAVILSEIRQEEELKMPEDVREQGKEEGVETEERVAVLRRLLAVPESCRRLLEPMAEEKIYGLVETVVPAESGFVIGYARTLEREKERGMLEGRAGEEFRILKWEFLFVVLLNAPSSPFQRKRFVYEVIGRLSAHYNLDPRTLLVYLCADTDGMPGSLKEVLLELYAEQVEDVPLRLAEAIEYRSLSEMEKERLRQALLHPYVARRLLRVLPEMRIYRLTHLLVPGESGFIVGYARTLDRGQEHGMLKNRRDEEFRVLKWEFIFTVVLAAPAPVFSRKQFVRSVLRQIAAHYNLSVNGLLDYFFLSAGDVPAGFMPGLMKLLQEIRLEEENAAGPESGTVGREASAGREVAGTPTGRERQEGKEAERPEGGSVSGKEGVAAKRIGYFLAGREYVSEMFGHVLRILEECGEVPDEVFERLGSVFAGDLLEAYRQEEVGRFMRRNRRAVWRFWTMSAKRLREMVRRIVTGEGVAGCLTALYGKSNVTEILKRAGISAEMFSGGPEGIWKAVTGNRDAEMFGVLLDSPPEFLAEMKRRMPEAERKELEVWLREQPGLMRKWLWRSGPAVLRRLMEEMEKAGRRMPAGIYGESWWQELLPFVYGRPEWLSYPEAVGLWISRISRKWTEEQKNAVYRVFFKNESLFPEWVRAAEREKRMEKAVMDVKEKERNVELNRQNKMKKEERDERKKAAEASEGPGKKKYLWRADEWKEAPSPGQEEHFYVANAGAVVLSPYLPRLFELAGWTEKGVFKDERARIRAVFAIQYLVFGQGKFQETELLLNKLLVNYRSEEPLPQEIAFLKEETELLDSLLRGAMGNWRVMEHTSVDGFRGSFLIRNGVMAETGELWQMTVEERSYDVLLDSLPWNISPVKYPWMEKPLYVKWR